MYLTTPSHHHLLSALLRKDFVARKSEGRGSRAASLLGAAVLLFLAATGTVWGAPRIDSLSRSTHVDGQGVDFSPYAEEDLAENNGTLLGGVFSGGVTMPIALNDNLSLFQALQNSTVNLAALSFSGTGSITTNQSTQFDANDVANRAFLQGAAGSSMSIFFTMTNSGKVNLNVTIDASTTHSATSFGGSSCSVQLKQGTTVIWSRFTSGGVISFNGDIVLPSSGWYQLLVSAGSNMDTRSPLGLQLAESRASFNISGQITENPSSGGGKKKK